MKKLFLIYFLAPLFTYAQSCVCFRSDFLNDYKESEFIAHVRITNFEENKQGNNIDKITFTTIELLKGKAIESMFIEQALGNSTDNGTCRLFLNPGDEIILYGKNDTYGLSTRTCYRNTFVLRGDPTFENATSIELGKLRALKEHASTIQTTPTYCHNFALDGDTRLLVEDLPLDKNDAYMGIYKIRFTIDYKIDRIDVVAPFSKEMDKKIRILLIKRKWEPCKLGDSRELLIGYFYYPKTSYRKSRLTSY